MTTTNTNKMELLVNSANGQYIPQIFAKSFGIPENFTNWDEIKEDVAFLAEDNSNENEDYWEVWDTILNNAELKSGFSLYHNEDLWAVPEGFDWDTLEF